MKVILVTLEWQTTLLIISDNAVADKAYNDLKTAMAEYDRYANDKTKTITIDHGCGERTFRVESLRCVGLDDLSQGEATMIEHAVWQKQIDAKITTKLVHAPPNQTGGDGES